MRDKQFATLPYVVIGKAVGAVLATHVMQKIMLTDGRIPRPRAMVLISPAGTSVELRWPSEVGVLYQPQGSVDLVRWTNLNTGELAGTGSDLRILESGPAANRPFAYYRVAVRRP